MRRVEEKRNWCNGGKQERVADTRETVMSAGEAEEVWHKKPGGQILYRQPPQQ